MSLINLISASACLQGLRMARAGWSACKHWLHCKVQLQDAGQATLEYLIVGLVVVCFALVLAMLFKEVDLGTFAEHISASSSHSVSGGGISAAGDILFF